MRIDLAFTGPFKFAGHYFIEDQDPVRLYRGPINVGRGDRLGERLIDANAYWAAVGLSQRLMLMVLPDDSRQFSLALMTRGESLEYVVVGEYHRVLDPNRIQPPAFLNSASIDLKDDPAAGRGVVLAHRPGRWHGTLTQLGPANEELGASAYSEVIEGDATKMSVRFRGGALEEAVTPVVHSNGWQGWTEPGDLVGSYNLSGGRALTGTLYDMRKDLRVWRREIISHDGTHKGVLHLLYKGSQRVGTQFGVLDFEAS